MITASPAPTFPGLVDLASASFDAAVLGCSDEFFAQACNLLSPKPAVFDPDRYTDHGKWMDGWESRRRRTVGEDWCVIRLGVRGELQAFDVDTSHFLGNHAPLARIEACDVPSGNSLESLDSLSHVEWIEVLEQAPLQAGSHNLFVVAPPRPATHLRLTITPDGGVARLRAFGKVIPAWDAPIDEQARAAIGSGHPGMVDLAALRHGGRALSCSDMFFAPMNNLIAPGRSTYMGGGWETRRRRGPGHDWILLELAAPGTIGVVEVDTGHFHGNHAQRCSLWGVHVSEVEPGGPGSGRGEPKKARLADLLASDRTAGGWHEVLPASAIAPERWHLILPETTLGPDRRLFLSSLDQRGPFTHVRLETFPDGGVARLRLYGHPTKVSG